MENETPNLFARKSWNQTQSDICFINITTFCDPIADVLFYTLIIFSLMAFPNELYINMCQLYNVLIQLYLLNVQLSHHDNLLDASILYTEVHYTLWLSNILSYKVLLISLLYTWHEHIMARRSNKSIAEILTPRSRPPLVAKLSSSTNDDLILERKITLVTHP